MKKHFVSPDLEKPEPEMSPFDVAVQENMNQ